MAQFSDGPVEWPWCVQLVHGAHSSRCSHWCPAAFPGTRISAAPLGGQKWERVSNSNCRKAHKSQGMTLDGQPLTTTATTLKPLLPQVDDALTWAALCPLSLSLPALSSTPAHTDPKSSRQAKSEAPEASDSSSTSSWSVLSSGAKKPRVFNIFPKKQSRAQQCTAEKRACNVRGMQVKKKKEERKRRRRDGDVRRGETSSAVRCSIAQRGEERKREQRRAHKRSSAA